MMLPYYIAQLVGVIILRYHYRTPTIPQLCLFPRTARAYIIEDGQNICLFVCLTSKYYPQTILYTS